MKHLSLFKTLINWSKKEFHSLPWRQKRSLYKTLVSEIMLQQTTVATVQNKFENFLQTFPTIEQLAFASEEEMLRAWKGLGYYRRAKNLRMAAIDIIDLYHGKIPQDFAQLKGIKGIGDYTASALLAIGGNKLALALDANLERVLARFYGIEVEKGLKLQKAIRELFETRQCLPEMTKLSARELNEALMDLGRVFCRARKVDCGQCFLQAGCEANKQNRPLDFPILTAKEKNDFIELTLVRFIVRKKKDVFVYQKQEGEWLAGQWELPTFVLEVQQKNFKQYPFLPEKTREQLDLQSSRQFRTSITCYKIKNLVVELSEHDFLQLHLQFRNGFFMNCKSDDLSTASMKALAL